MRQAAQAAAKAKKRRGVSRSVATVVIIALVVVIGGLVLTIARSMAPTEAEPAPTQMVDFPGPGLDQTVLVDIATGASGEAMAVELAAKGVVATAEAFVTAFRANTRAGQIQPGTYRLQLQLPAADAVAALLDPDNRESQGLVIMEGLRAAQVYERIAEALNLPLAEVEAAAADLDAIGLPAEAEGDIEGWLFPATYNITSQSTPTNLMREMVIKTKSTLTDLNVPQNQWRETLVMASLVEKEVRRDQDRPLAARVILNRLAHEPAMRLQFDSTVHYGANDYSSVFTTDEQRADESNLYNTYVHYGLPPGAISNPGTKAIEAVLNPADNPEEGQWIFFNAVDLCTGETEFNVDETGHAESVAKMQAWIAENPDWAAEGGCG